MKNLHGYARELAINEMLNKQELLDEAIATFGFEFIGTVELFKMKDAGASYATMLAYFEAVDNGLTQECDDFEF